jgi:putative serine protease PepD
MVPPRHLWSGAWREESADSDRDLEARRRSLADEAPTQVHEPPEDEPSSGSSGRGRRRGLIASAAVIALVGVGVGAYFIGTGSSDDKGGSAVAEAPAALPAASANAKPLPGSAGQSPTARIYAAASPAVVSIRTSTGSGTGFLIDNRTTIVTNAHVVEGSSTVTIRFGADGQNITGTVKGTDPSSDLAVVTIPGGAPNNAKPLTLADSNKLIVGNDVVAIGNPFGLDRTVTEGVISALDRQIQAPNGFEIDGAIQTDAAINPGNSGGPLLDQSGNVIGVNSQIETGSQGGGNVGIGFAIPSNTLRQVVPVLEQGKRVAHAWLGIQSGQTQSGGGAAVSDVTAGGPAQAGGLQAGDTILQIDGQKINDFTDVSKVVNQKQPGDKIDVQVRRGGSQASLKVTLGTRPNRVP